MPAVIRIGKGMRQMNRWTSSGVISLDITSNNSSRHYAHHVVFSLLMALYLVVVASGAWSIGVKNALPTHVRKRYQSKPKWSLEAEPVSGGGAPAELPKMKKFQQQLGSFESLQFEPAMQQERRVRMYDYSAELIPFQKAWEWQRESLDGQLDRLKNENSEGSQFIAAPQNEESLDVLLEGGQDVIFMLQHEPVYTLGTGSDEAFLLGNTHGVDVVRIERGGEVTYHGPGQLVVYPILDLRGYQQDIHWYMRALEEAILLALKSVGVTEACREEDVTGVWVSTKKIAALGIKARRWVTMHGLAVNVDSRSLHNFDGIVPCGLVGRKVCCINDFLDEAITVEDFAPHMQRALEDTFQIKLSPI